MVLHQVKVSVQPLLNAGLVEGERNDKRYDLAELGSLVEEVDCKRRILPEWRVTDYDPLDPFVSGNLEGLNFDASAEKVSVMDFTRIALRVEVYAHSLSNWKLLQEGAVTG